MNDATDLRRIWREALRALRVDARLTQEQLARKMGRRILFDREGVIRLDSAGEPLVTPYTRSWVSRVERGLFNIDIAQIEEWAEACGSSMRAAFKRVEKKRNRRR